MNINQAKNIIAALADGINPVTGKVLPDNDSCNQPQVIRALHSVLAVLGENEKAAQSIIVDKPDNAGKSWTKEDEETLCEMFDSSCAPDTISQYFKRTDRAIAARLVKLGKIADRDDWMLRLKD